MNGILFKNHTMNYPEDERTLACSIYRDDMVRHLRHGDEIKTYSSGVNVWKYDEGIRLNEISWWKGKKVYDFHYYLETSNIPDVEVSPDGTKIRSNLLFGKLKFLQLVMPSQFYKESFKSYVRNRLRVFIIYYLLSLNTYTIKNVSEIKILVDKVLIHGKDGENVFEPSKGFNAYVDMNLSVPDTDKFIDGKPFDLKARVFVKSLDSVTDQASIVGLAKLSLDYYVKQTVLYLKEWYGEMFYIV